MIFLSKLNKIYWIRPDGVEFPFDINEEHSDTAAQFVKDEPDEDPQIVLLKKGWIAQRENSFLVYYLSSKQKDIIWERSKRFSFDKIFVDKYDEHNRFRNILADQPVEMLWEAIWELLKHVPEFRLYEQKKLPFETFTHEYMKNTKIDNPPKKLYHFTSLKNAIGILEKEEIIGHPVSLTENPALISPGEFVFTINTECMKKRGIHFIPYVMTPSYSREAEWIPVSKIEDDFKLDVSRHQHIEYSVNVPLNCIEKLSFHGRWPEKPSILFIEISELAKKKGLEIKSYDWEEEWKLHEAKIKPISPQELYRYVKRNIPELDNANVSIGDKRDIDSLIDPIWKDAKSFGFVILDRDNIKSIDNRLKKVGWFVAHHKNIENDKFVEIYIQPFYTEKSMWEPWNDTVNIFKPDNVPRFLYHFTDIRNVEKIEKNGLIPKSSASGGFSYPNRVYFFTSMPSKESVLGIAEDMIHKSIKSVDDIAIVKIDTKKAVEYGKGRVIKYYKDPNIMFGSVFTYSHIKPEAIDSIFIYDDDNKMWAKI